MKEYYNFRREEYLAGIIPRMLIFSFLGIGWDVLVTLVQQLLSGKVMINALCPASAWMYPIYATIPLLFYPVAAVLKRNRLGYFVRVLCFLAIFYIVEYGYATFLSRFGIIAWSYDWYLPHRYNGTNGYVSFHPVIMAMWTVFVVFAEGIDFVLRSSFKTLANTVKIFVDGK